MDWSRGDLSKAAKVSQETIKNIEHGIFRPQEVTELALIRACAAHGVEFIGLTGVRQVEDTVVRLEGNDGFRKFVDSVYETCRMPYTPELDNKQICISNVNEHNFAKYLGDYLNTHIERMNDIKDVKMKVLVRNSEASNQSSEARGSVYRECRQLKGDYSGDVPFYVYGNNLAILIFDEKKPPQIVIISSSLVSKAYKEQFNVLWSISAPIKD